MEEVHRGVHKREVAGRAFGVAPVILVADSSPGPEVHAADDSVVGENQVDWESED